MKSSFLITQDFGRPSVVAVGLNNWGHQKGLIRYFCRTEYAKLRSFLAATSQKHAKIRIKGALFYTRAIGGILVL